MGEGRCERVTPTGSGDGVDVDGVADVHEQHLVRRRGDGRNGVPGDDPADRQVRGAGGVRQPGGGVADVDRLEVVLVGEVEAVEDAALDAGQGGAGGHGAGGDGGDGLEGGGAAVGVAVGPLAGAGAGGD